MKIRSWTDYMYILFAITILAMVLRWTVISFYFFPSESMWPTIKARDIVLVNKIAYGLRFVPGGNSYFPQAVKNGELVLFSLPHREDKVYVKRLLAQSGEEIEIIDGQVKVNGKPVLRSDQEEVWEGVSWPRRLSEGDKVIQFPKTKIPEGHGFVLNDNRAQLEDSRSFGMVPINFIQGKVVLLFKGFSQ